MSESFYTRSAAFYDAIHAGKPYADGAASVQGSVGWPRAGYQSIPADTSTPRPGLKSV